MSGNKACLLPISPLLILTISIRPKIFHSTHPQTIQRGVNFSAVDGIVHAWNHFGSQGALWGRYCRTCPYINHTALKAHTRK